MTCQFWTTQESHTQTNENSDKTSFIYLFYKNESLEADVCKSKVRKIS